MNAQTRFLANHEPREERSTASFYVQDDNAADLFLEFNDSRTDYPDSVLQGLKDNGYFDQDDPGNGTYLIPLGQGLPVARNDNSTDALTGLAHIKPVRFADPAGEHLAPLRDSGRLYLFVGGHLWRELVISDDGNTFRDINLAKYQGCDQRPPDNGMETENGAITVPYRLNGGPVLLQIAFSEIPWSWALIEILGGLADNDPRHLPDLPAHQPYQWHRDNVDHTLRMQRTSLLNLNNFDHAFTPEQIKETGLLSAGTVDRHYNRPDANHRCPLPCLNTMDVEDKLIIAALQDPLGIALDTIADIQLDLHDLKQHIEDVDNDEHAASAVYAHQLFFNEALHQRAWKVHNPNRLDRRYRELAYKDESESAQALREAAERLSEDAIKETLRTEPRQALRDKIRTNQKTLANWIEAKDSEGHGVRDRFTHFIDVSDALLDYAWLAVPREKDMRANDFAGSHWHYGALWGRLKDLIDGGDVDPAMYDSGFNINDSGAPPTGTDPMDNRIADLLMDNTHPLHPALFPSEQQVADEQPHEPDLQHTHDPARNSDFRPAAFAAISGDMDDIKYLQKIQNQTETILAGLLLRFKKQWQQATEQQQTQQLKLLVRWGKSTGHSSMYDLKVANSQQVPEGYEPVRVNIEQRIITPNKAPFCPSSGSVRLFAPGTDNIIGSVLSQEVNVNRNSFMAEPGATPGDINATLRPVGLDQLFTRHELQQAMDKANPLEAHEISITRVYRPKLEDLTRELHGETTSNPAAALKSRALIMANKSLPPFMAVLEVFNLSAIFQKTASGKNSPIKALSESSYSLASLAYAVLDTSIRLTGEERTINGLKPLVKHKVAIRQLEILVEGTTQTRSGITFSNFRLAGAGLALVGSIMALVESGRQARDGNHASAIAHGVEGTALLGLTASTARQAIIKEAIKRTAITRLLAFAGPWGWAFMAVSFAAAIIAERLKLNNLERWAAFGPFGRIPGERMTQEYANLSGRAAHRDLLSHLFTPQTRILASNNRGKPMIEVEIRVPGLSPDAPLEHHLYQLRSTRPPERLEPVMAQPILADNDDPLSRIGLRIRYLREHSESPVNLQLKTRLRSAGTKDWLPHIAKGESDRMTSRDTTRYSSEGWHYTERRLAGKYDQLLSDATLSAL